MWRYDPDIESSLGKQIIVPGMYPFVLENIFYV